MINNIFMNSRFSALKDEISFSKKDLKKEDSKSKSKSKIIDKEMVNKLNVFKADPREMEKRYNKYPNEKERQRIKEDYAAEDKAYRLFKKKEDEKRLMESLKMEYFPELTSNKKEKDAKIEMENDKKNNDKKNNDEKDILHEPNYIDKLKKVIEQPKSNVTTDPDLDNLEPGWIMIKKDKMTNKKTIKMKPNPANTINFNDNVNVNINLTIINYLVDLHDKRTQEQIELNGYDTWEYMYKFPDWFERENEEEDDDLDENEYGEDDEDNEDYYFEEYF
jgi:hypothetical protein